MASFSPSPKVRKPMFETTPFSTTPITADILLPCRDCKNHATFVFSVRDHKTYLQRQFTSFPKRCPVHLRKDRERRKAAPQPGGNQAITFTTATPRVGIFEGIVSNPDGLEEILVTTGSGVESSLSITSLRNRNDFKDLKRGSFLQVYAATLKKQAALSINGVRLWPGDSKTPNDEHLLLNGTVVSVEPNDGSTTLAIRIRSQQELIRSTVTNHPNLSPPYAIRYKAKPGTLEISQIHGTYPDQRTNLSSSVEVVAPHQMAVLANIPGFNTDLTANPSASPLPWALDIFSSATPKHAKFRTVEAKLLTRAASLLDDDSAAALLNKGIVPFFTISEHRAGRMISRIKSLLSDINRNGMTRRLFALYPVSANTTTKNILLQDACSFLRDNTLRAVSILDQPLEMIRHDSHQARLQHFALLEFTIEPDPDRTSPTFSSLELPFADQRTRGVGVENAPLSTILVQVPNTDTRKTLLTPSNDEYLHRPLQESAPLSGCHSRLTTAGH
jgi:hypothetical protein